MAATDQTYRNQKILDIVFAVSSILTLLSIVGLFYQDYHREWKQIQREFRDTDEAVTARQLVNQVQDKDLDSADALDQQVGEARKAVVDARKSSDAAIRDAQAKREKLALVAAGVKADYDSAVSLYDIAVEQRDESDSASRASRDAEVQQFDKRVQDLKGELKKANEQLDEAEEALLKAQKPVKDAEDDLARKEDQLKKVISKIDTVAKAVAKKKWKAGDWVRSLPVIDGFASPLKIQQYTLDEYPIDYSFRRVTRYDRCTTCHLGMEQDKFSKEALTKLSETDGADPAKEKLKRLRDLYVKRQKNGEAIGFDPGDLPGSLPSVKLTRAQVNQFCVHPRLDLFVDGNSPHPAEKFGCTSCHAGQGSSTDFDNASHVPSTYAERQEWIKEHGWEMTHGGDWEYPMLPKRFVESSCIKCHHQVSDLVRYGSRDEAPKVVRGYNIIRENGCFGCHEIAGTKRGLEIGPDLRLEPSLPLEAMDAGDREKLLADVQNPPGAMRKVGPSLYRLSEKTNADWVRRWVNDPRGFRPTTKMPHFFNLSNNRPEVLPDEQKGFPAAEIDSIAFYLLEESKKYLEGKDIYRRALEEHKKRLEAKGASLTDAEKQEIADLARRLERSAAPVLQLMTEPVPLEKKLIDGDGKEVRLPDAVTDANARKQHLAEGAELFRERGCLACHQHQGTSKSVQVTKPELNNLQITVPGVTSVASFAPDLSRLSAKLGPEKGDAQAKRRWLVQWILNPNVSFPRTRMPITHLDVNQAAAVADWLLSEESQGLDEWPQVPATDSLEVLRKLAGVYLVKAPSVSRKEAEEVLNVIDQAGAVVKGFPVDREVKYDADERRLQNEMNKQVSANDLKWYIGKKAISRYGCYGCHDVPGFETGKPIGTPLNDWGKKDPERLAFEDVIAYVQHGHKNKRSEEHGFEIVDGIEDDKGNGPMSEKGRDVYERYFFLALEHHQRDGFLHQKLIEPRSYDFNRMRAWDDRLKMPQFKFNHEKVDPKEGETEEQAANRAEMEARDAVMTFVLGLVAEPTPAKYLPQPSSDRLAEIKGRKVLDKFNCAGCHQVRSGVYEFKDTDNLKELLQSGFASASPSLLPDHIFPTHNAWVGQRPTGGRLLAFGVAPKKEEAEGQPIYSVRLTQALQFLTKQDGKETAQNIPAASIIALPEKDQLSRADPWGGAFTELMVPYLYGLNSVAYPVVGSIRDPRRDDKEVRSALPPSLIREGEKVQPVWLHQFLRDPTVIRPRAVLRMPKFNFSDAEVAALVDYFAAADRLENPAASVTNLYLARQHASPQVLHDAAVKYAAKLGPEKLKERADKLKALWEEVVKYQELPDAQRRREDAKQILDAAKEAEKKETDAAKKKAAESATQRSQKEFDDAEKRVKTLEGQLQSKDFADLRKKWEAGEAYATDAYRIMAQGGDKGSCLKCHQIGNLLPDDNKAPRLDLAGQRLRPEWMLHWISNPDRLLPYPSPMPAYFPRKFMGNEEVIKGQEYRNFFDGDSLDDIEALRNILMNFQEVVALPGNRFYRPGK